MTTLFPIPTAKERHAKFEEQNPDICEYLQSVDPKNVIIGLTIVVSDDGLLDFTDRYKYLLNLYYPRGRWWETEDFVDAVYVGDVFFIASSDNFKIHLVTSISRLCINIYGVYASVYIDDEWTIETVNEHIKSVLMNQFFKYFRCKLGV